MDEKIFKQTKNYQYNTFSFSPDAVHRREKKLMMS